MNNNGFIIAFHYCHVTAFYPSTVDVHEHPCKTFIIFVGQLTSLVCRRFLPTPMIHHITNTNDPSRFLFRPIIKTSTSQFCTWGSRVGRHTTKTNGSYTGYHNCCNAMQGWADYRTAGLYHSVPDSPNSKLIRVHWQYFYSANALPTDLTRKHYSYLKMRRRRSPIYGL